MKDPLLKKGKVYEGESKEIAGSGSDVFYGI